MTYSLGTIFCDLLERVHLLCLKYAKGEIVVG